jgi:hypothetical protein
MWSWWIVAASDGHKRRRLRALNDSSTHRLNEAGSGRHSFLLRWQRGTREQNQDLFAEWRNIVVKCWNGVPKYAGFITDWEWDSDRGVIDVKTVEFRAILRRRLLFPVGGYGFGTLTCVGQSRRGLMYQILYRSTKGNYSQVWDLLNVLPATSEPGGLSLEIPNYKFMTAEQALSDQQNVGGDVDFEPRWNAEGKLELLTRIAPDHSPRLDGAPVTLNKAALRPSALGLKLASSGTKMRTGTFALGDGAEQNRPWGDDATVAQSGGIPSLDIAESFGRIEDIGELEDQARAAVNSNKAPIKQFEVSGFASRVMPALQMGSPIRVYTQGDEMIDPGWINLRCMGVTHTTKHKVNLEVQVA